MLDNGPEVYSLPQLQDRIKRDPGAYMSDFELQLRHFYSTLDVFRLNPQNIPKEIFQLMIFIAQTSPYYSKYGVCNLFIEKLLSELKTNASIMTSEMRLSIVTSLILLSNQKIIDIVYLLPLWFDLMRLPDKNLRSKLLKHIVSSIVNPNTKRVGKKTALRAKSRLALRSKLIDSSFSVPESCDYISWSMKEAHQHSSHQAEKKYNISLNYDLNKFNSTIISFLRGRMESSTDILRSLAIFIEVYRKNVWNNSQTVNIIANCCLGSTSSKVASTAARFLLGKSWSMEEFEEDLADEEEKKELAAEAAKAMKSALLGVSSTSRKKKLEKARQAMKRMEKKNKVETSSIVKSNQCIDLIHNPQEFAETVFQRVTRHSDPFEVRITLIGLVSRLIERHQLILVNYYSFLCRYISPNNKNVTNILAFLAQACHDLIPPQELAPTIKLLMDNFVNECCKPEIIVIGLNTIREICQRVPLVMDKDKLLDLANFRKMNNKGVSIAAKSLINLYREIMPTILHRSLLSRDAAMNIKDGPSDSSASYGYSKIDTTVSGVDLLAKYNMKKGRSRQREEELDSEGEREFEIQEEPTELDVEEEEELETLVDEDEFVSGEISGEEEETTSVDKHSIQDEKNFLLDRILDQSDFRMIKKLKARVEATKALGISERINNELSTASSDSEYSDEESDSQYSEKEDEESSDGDVTRDIRQEIVRNMGRKRLNKQQRIQSIMKGREDRETFKEKRIRESLSKKQSIPNNVKSRNKPIMMVIKKKGISKKSETASMKMSRIKKHLKNLKKDTGKKKRFRKR
ncbi:SDA1-domain-containing protein [Cryptosporidium felis]|nr:SDA1-domain-containing protein [Cryptosporidium felis]